MSNNFKELTKNTSILGAARIVEFVVGLLKIKLCAILLGVTGIGVFNQLTFLSNKMSEFTLLSTSEALVKQLAGTTEANNSTDLVLSALKSYAILLCFFMLFALVILYLLSENITLYVFGDAKYFQAFMVALASLPLLVVNSVPYSILRAFKNMKAIAKARVWITLINILHTLPLIYLFSLQGAVFSIFLSHLVGLIVNYMYAKKLYFKKFSISLKEIYKAKLEISYVRELVKFSGFGLSIGLYVIFSEFICRSIVVSQLGIEAIGLYSPVIMWSSLFTSILITSLSTQLYSSLCQSKNNTQINNLLNDGLRLATLGLLPLLFLAIPYRELIITVFYSKDFLGVEKYLPYHFLGVIFQVWYSVLASSMSSTGRIRHHGVFRFFYLSLDIVITYYFVKEFGLYGWMLKHIVSPFVFYFVYLNFCNKHMSFKIVNANFLLMLYLLIGSLSLIFVDGISTSGYAYNFLLGPILVIASYSFLLKAEKLFIKKVFSRVGILR